MFADLQVVTATAAWSCSKLFCAEAHRSFGRVWNSRGPLCREKASRELPSVHCSPRIHYDDTPLCLSSRPVGLSLGSGALVGPLRQRRREGPKEAVKLLPVSLVSAVSCPLVLTRRQVGLISQFRVAFRWTSSNSRCAGTTSSFLCLFSMCLKKTGSLRRRGIPGSANSR